MSESTLNQNPASGFTGYFADGKPVRHSFGFPFLWGGQDRKRESFPSGTLSQCNLAPVRGGKWGGGATPVTGSVSSICLGHSALRGPCSQYSDATEITSVSLLLVLQVRYVHHAFRLRILHCAGRVLRALGALIPKQVVARHLLRLLLPGIRGWSVQFGLLLLPHHSTTHFYGGRTPLLPPFNQV